jgi:hypothetical protein
MLTEYGVLKPDVPRPAGPADEVHERWRREWHKKYPDWKPLDPKYNIRFVPPEHLLHKVISIKAARPGPFMGLDIFDGLCIDDVLTTRGRLTDASW